MSSTTLQQNSKKNIHGRTTSLNSIPNNLSKLKDVPRSASVKSVTSIYSNKETTRKMSSDGVEYEIVDKRVNFTPETVGLGIDRTNNQSPSIKSNVSDFLQYGDVYFRCDSI